jgi:MraZ protein
MFRGQFVHSIDAKGRVSLPARFRDPVMAEREGQLILTPSPFDPCLHLYPLTTWEQFEERISELSTLDPNIVKFRRLYVSAAIECELDRAGRVLIPPHLREKAELTKDKDVVWAGMGRLIEVWSKARWDAELGMTPEQQQAFKKAVMEQVRI